jgi:hypothetical protein
MVMSVPALNPRATCIRCGGVQLDNVEPLIARVRFERIDTVAVAIRQDILPLTAHFAGGAIVHVGSGI